MIYYKKHGVLLHETRDWEWEKYGQDIQGKGDCIVNTMWVVIRYLRGESTPEYQIKDIGEAVELIERCGVLLTMGRRWPKELNSPADCAYRYYYSLTRDPFIYQISAEFILDPKRAIIIDIPIPLYTPTVWSWRKALLGKKNCYWFWRKFQNSKIPYVKRMQDLMKSLVV